MITRGKDKESNGYRGLYPLEDFPGGPVVKTLYFHRFEPWAGKFCMLHGPAKKKKKKKKERHRSISLN